MTPAESILEPEPLNRLQWVKADHYHWHAHDVELGCAFRVRRSTDGHLFVVLWCDTTGTRAGNATTTTLSQAKQVAEEVRRGGPGHFGC